MNPMQGPEPKRTWLRAAGVLAMGAGLGSRQTAVHAATLEVGRPAPPLVLHALDGRSIATDDLRGQVIILTFWTTWCGPCRTEFPLLSAHAARHADKGLRILGFSLDGPAELPAVYGVAVKLNFPVGLFGSAYTGGYGRIWCPPVNFTVDHRGLLADNGRNSREPAWTAERLKRIITPLLR